MEEPTYKLEKLNFDGPLDLLLHLIEKDRIDIYDIPIADITAQYLNYLELMKEEDLDTMSDFLLMAATLLDIKARMLLPQEGSDEDEEEESDPREELVQRLLLYKRFRYMAEELEKQEDEASRYIYKEADLPSEVLDYTPPIDMDSLLSEVDMQKLRSIFLEVMRRKEYRRDTRRESFGIIKRDRIPVKSRISSLISYARSRKSFSFRSLLSSASGKEEVVVTFLAVLELMKVGAVKVRQDETGGDMEVVCGEHIDEAEQSLGSIEDL